MSVMRKLASGWHYATGRGRAVGAVVLVVQFDPDDTLPGHGVKRIELSSYEVDALVADLRQAQGLGLRPVGDRR
ncbi:MAG TPA: hypothetical protein VFP61_07520 [Acidimicrobiales bacterium]|nr:hypothetical protein [Acidimicrobiales bacterium]